MNCKSVHKKFQRRDSEAPTSNSTCYTWFLTPGGLLVS